MHTALLWICFNIGVFSYWLARAYYGINPPNPIANSYWHWLQRSWAPLTVRFILNNAAFGILFTPGLADKALVSMGWTDYEWLIVAITKVPEAALFFGHAFDSIMDKVLSKMPFINQYIPQMPGPLPQTPAEVKP